MSNTDIGAMAAFFYVAYAIVQIPSGHLYGKRGVRHIFSGAVILTSIATFIMGLSNSAAHLKAARAILGFAEGPINIGSLTTINRWFPTKEKGIATGVFMASIKFACLCLDHHDVWLAGSILHFRYSRYVLCNPLVVPGQG